MSDNTPQVQEVKTTLETTQSESTDKPATEVKAAYTISLKDNGEFGFEVTGKDPTLVDLLALHELARQRIEDVTASTHVRGHALTHMMLNELGQLVRYLGQALAATQLSKPGQLVGPSGLPLAPVGDTSLQKP